MMKAAQILEANGTPVMVDVPEPKQVEADQVLVDVKAVALSNVAKKTAQGRHYSAPINYPQTVGLDGVGQLADGTRVYFDHPLNGALTQKAVVPIERVITIPAGIDDITAAAIPNAGMSSMAALVYRAHFKPGETVLINGATGTAGKLAVKIAKALGAKKVIATGRRAAALRDSGADVILATEGLDLADANDFKTYLKGLALIVKDVDVVLDYLYGRSTEAILTTIADKIGGQHAVRYVEIGSIAGQSLNLPASILRSSKIELMGSGLQSVDADDLQGAVELVYDLADQHGWQVETKRYPLAAVADAFDAPNQPRAVVTI